jgi:hypothetical protein
MAQQCASCEEHIQENIVYINQIQATTPSTVSETIDTVVLSFRYILVCGCMPYTSLRDQFVEQLDRLQQKLIEKRTHTTGRIAVTAIGTFIQKIAQADTLDTFVSVVCSLPCDYQFIYKMDPMQIQKQALKQHAQVNFTKLMDELSTLKGLYQTEVKAKEKAMEDLAIAHEQVEDLVTEVKRGRFAKDALYADLKQMALEKQELADELSGIRARIASITK